MYRMEKLQNQLKTWRRDLHKRPELGWCEYQTTAYIYHVLKPLCFTLHLGNEVSSKEKMGVPSSEVDRLHFKRAEEAGIDAKLLEKMAGNQTGLVATFDTGKAGKHMAYRFDIDALPIFESNDASHLPAKEGFRSIYDGHMHACGHDGHTAIGLGLAQLIHEHRNELNGVFTLIFQPAEEGVRGAKAIVEKGWLDHADYFLAGHIMGQPLGTVVPGVASALATTKLNVTFTGKSAHAGGNPEEGRNALLAAAQVTVQLHSIPPHSQGATRLNVGTFHAGSGRNIIADRAELELETRGETTELNAYMAENAKRIIRHTAEAWGVDYVLDRVGEGISAKSDPQWLEMVKRALAASNLVEEVSDRYEAIGGSEDATFMMERVQQNGGLATYLLYGSTLAEKHHHPFFDYDERVLEIAVDSLWRLTLHLQ
ncbi:peptidase M20 [Shouchella clausii]|uniref:Peptidase M20 n=2 Tax=Shouchella clausii TaxID=79880 RepID=A0A268NU60_SHOCL|nr:amidohydrolase [Shouchella clausii]PAE87043.1 peptidase M20 [Shouchella clausii]